MNKSLKTLYIIFAIMEIYAGGFIQIILIGLLAISGWLKMKKLEGLLENAIVKSLYHSIDVLASTGITFEWIMNGIRSKIIGKYGADIYVLCLLESFEEGYYNR